MKEINEKKKALRAQSPEREAQDRMAADGSTAGVDTAATPVAAPVAAPAATPVTAPAVAPVAAPAVAPAVAPAATPVAAPANGAVPAMAPGYMQTLRRQEEQLRQARAREIMAKLRLQEREARELYPKLNLEEELKDPRFAELIRCGVDVRSAFEVVHKDEILSASMEYAAREVERMLTNKVLSGGNRPGENGSTFGPAVTRVDPKTMSRKERRDIATRVARGEKISF